MASGPIAVCFKVLRSVQCPLHWPTKVADWHLPTWVEAQIADLKKGLASARAAHMEAEVARTAGAEQSTTLARCLLEKEVALQRAEQKLATVETKFDEHKKATLGDRALFEEKIAKLTEQLDAESDSAATSWPS